MKLIKSRQRKPCLRTDSGGENTHHRSWCLLEKHGIRRQFATNIHYCWKQRALLREHGDGNPWIIIRICICQQEYSLHFGHLIEMKGFNCSFPSRSTSLVLSRFANSSTNLRYWGILSRCAESREEIDEFREHSRPLISRWTYQPADVGTTELRHQSDYSLRKINNLGNFGADSTFLYASSNLAGRSFLRMGSLVSSLWKTSFYYSPPFFPILWIKSYD